MGKPKGMTRFSPLTALVMYNIDLSPYHSKGQWDWAGASATIVRWAFLDIDRNWRLREWIDSHQQSYDSRGDNPFRLTKKELARELDPLLYSEAIVAELLKEVWKTNG